MGMLLITWFAVILNTCIVHSGSSFLIIISVLNFLLFLLANRILELQALGLALAPLCNLDFCSPFSFAVSPGSDLKKSSDQSRSGTEESQSENSSSTTPVVPSP